MKNYKAGKPIKSFDVLLDQKIVYVPRWGSTRAVAFFLNWQFRLLKRWIDSGQICKAERIKDKK